MTGFESKRQAAQDKMELADAYASAVAATPNMPTPRERKLAVERIERARNALEAALEQQQQAKLTDLRNRDNPMDIERAKAVATVASVLVDTAKVENDYLKITGQDRSSFLEQPTDELHPELRLDGPAAHNPFPTSVRHRLQG